MDNVQNIDKEANFWADLDLPSRIGQTKGVQRIATVIDLLWIHPVSCIKTNQVWLSTICSAHIAPVIQPVHQSA